jgi:hypothetical protein
LVRQLNGRDSYDPVPLRRRPTTRGVVMRQGGEGAV